MIITKEFIFIVTVVILIVTEITAVNRHNCNSNADCSVNSLCSNGLCISPCVNQFHCGPHALCVINNHVPHCECRNGYLSHPEFECVKKCSESKDCNVNEVCINSTEPISTCRCSSNASWHPESYSCVLPCQSDSVCPDYEKCIGNKCLSACVKSGPCGDNTNCYTENHERICECLPGLHGDPYNRGCE